MMDVNGTSLRQLKLISHHKVPVKDSRLVSHFIGLLDNEQFNAGLARLAAKQLITIDEESKLAITEVGKAFLSTYELYGSDFVFSGHFQFAVLKFLYDLDDWIKPDDFPDILQSHAPHVPGYTKGYCMMHYLQFDPEMNSYVSEQYHHYKLNEAGRAKYAFLAKKLLIEEEPMPANPSNQNRFPNTYNNKEQMSTDVFRPARPVVFIGSSSESLQIVSALVENLDRYCECIPWNAGVFGASEYSLESLLSAIVETKPDFAIFVLSADDKLESRNVNHRTPRDNVIFELGLAMGALSRQRVFMVMDRSVKIKIPSDLFGLTPADFEMPSERGNLTAAVYPACSKILKSIQRLGLIANEKAAEKNDLEKYKELAKQYDTIHIENEDERIAKKEEIGARLGEYIVRHELSRSEAANLYSEGALVGLLYSIITNPSEADAAILLKFYSRLKHPFSSFRLVDAVESLLSGNLIRPADRADFLTLLQTQFQHDNANLHKRIVKAWVGIKEFGAIQILSANKGNLKLNETVHISDGSPKLNLSEGPMLGSIFGIEGDYPGTAIDIYTDFNGQQVKELSYTYIPHTKFIFYANVRVHNEIKGFKEVWLAFRTDITSPMPEDYEDEVSVPVIAKQDLYKWRRVEVNLTEATEIAYGAAHYRYDNLIKVRVRGAGKIADIIIR